MAHTMQQSLSSVPLSAKAASFLAYSKHNSVSCWDHHCKPSIKENKSSVSYAAPCKYSSAFSLCSRLAEPKGFSTEQFCSLSRGKTSYTICCMHFNFIFFKKTKM